MGRARNDLVSDKCCVLVLWQVQVQVLACCPSRLLCNLHLRFPALSAVDRYSEVAASSCPCWEPYLANVFPIFFVDSGVVVAVEVATTKSHHLRWARRGRVFRAGMLDEMVSDCMWTVVGR